MLGLNFVLIGVLVGALTLLITIAIFASCYRKVEPDEALVVSTSTGAEPRVAFSARVVVPMLQRASTVSLREHAIAFDRRGEAALRTRTEQVELQATFRLRVNPTTEGVLEVSREMGERASDPGAIRERFAPKLEEALETIARACTAQEIEEDRARFKDAVMALAAEDLQGFVLVDVNLTGISVGASSPYRG